MNCNKLWTREVLMDILPKSFLSNQYKWHRENILFEREKSLFPETQAIVVREMKLEELASIRDATRKEIAITTGRLPSLWHPRMLEIRDVHNKICKLVTVKQPKRKFIRKCPVEKCQGFLNTSWKCSLCTNCICKDCNEIKRDSHVCDPETVETMKLLKDDTKPCPKCGEMIFKASGCSQMWCTSCHTVFDWNTMLIDTGIVHNPHYYEYQRQNGTLARQPGDVPCGGGYLPTFYEFLMAFGNGQGPEMDYLSKVHRLCIHMVHYYMIPQQNIDNRKKFMKGKITEYQFKVRIQRTEKSLEKIRDFRNITEMTGNVLKDLLIQVLHFVIPIQDLKVMVDNLGEYTNDAIRRVRKVYDGCVTEIIDLDKLEMVPCK